MGKVVGRRGLGAALIALFLPGAALAQSGISGRVTDNTGAVLPGVTVEAASSALIEGARTAVTDSRGQYEIIDLRPGTYSVTYSLQGFATLVRDEIRLPADFTLTINVALSVGTIEETVTVTGESPIVDTQNVRRTEVLTRELQEELPTGRALWSYAVLIPGVKIGRPDVGGTSGHQQVGIAGAGAVGFQRDSVYEIDGLDISMYIGDNWMPYLNPMLVAETSYTTAGIGAETQRGGVRMNMVPKEGGNRTSGSFFLGGSLSDAWQSDNWTRRLGDLGVQSRKQGDARDGIPQIDRLYDLNFEIGGPIFENRVWYHASARRLVVNNQVLNSVTRDGNRGLDTNSLTDAALRFTWQVTERNKFSVGFDKLRKRRFTQHVAGEDVDTASTLWTSPHYDTGTAKWTSAISSRLLAEFGFSLAYQDWDPSYQEGIRRDRPADGAERPEDDADHRRRAVAGGPLRRHPGDRRRVPARAAAAVPDGRGDQLLWLDLSVGAEPPPGGARRLSGRLRGNVERPGRPVVWDSGLRHHGPLVRAGLPHGDRRVSRVRAHLPEGDHLADRYV